MYFKLNYDKCKKKFFNPKNQKKMNIIKFWKKQLKAKTIIYDTIKYIYLIKMNTYFLKILLYYQKYNILKKNYIKIHFCISIIPNANLPQKQENTILLKIN